MKTEIKKLLARWALDFAFWILPECGFKLKLSKFLIANIKKFKTKNPS